jgi:hypothetical protein
MSSPSKGLLVLMADIDPAVDEDEFNEWYLRCISRSDFHAQASSQRGAFVLSTPARGIWQSTNWRA